MAAATSSMPRHTLAALSSVLGLDAASIRKTEPLVHAVDFIVAITGKRRKVAEKVVRGLRKRYPELSQSLSTSKFDGDGRQCGA